jgi:hypothetical protein
MLALPDLVKKAVNASLLITTAMLVSCASQKGQVALVNDPDAATHESMIPWNKQEKWETSGGQLAGMTDRR